MKKLLTIVGVSVLALSLVLGLALPALAAPEWTKPWVEDFQGKIVKGKVLSVDALNHRFVIKSGDDELTILVDDNTKYFKIGVPGRIMSLARHWKEFRQQNQEEAGPSALPQMGLKLKWLRPFGEEAGFGDIKEGDRVVVWAEENGNLLAKRVLITKVTTYASVSGTIIGVSADSITIKPANDGDEITLTYNDSTIFILKGIIQVVPGQSARAIYDSDNNIAKTVTVHQEVVELID